MAQEEDKTEPLSSYAEIVSSLGVLLPLSALAAFSTGVASPVTSYVNLNFFAQRHTDLPPSEIHCDSDMLSTHCKEAVLDSTRLMMVMAVVGPLVQFLLLPAVGVLSDAIGRKKLAVAYSLLVIYSAGIGVSFLLFNTSLYWMFAVMPFVSNPVTLLSPGTVIYNAMATDLIKRPASRTTAFGLVQAAEKLATLLGTFVGSFMSVKAACCTGFVAGILSFLFLVWKMPETLPPERRLRAITWRMFLPGVELGILWRTPALQLLSITIMWATFVGAGWGRILPLYMQFEMNFTAQHSYFASMFANASEMIALGLLLRPLVLLVGEAGVIAFDLVLGTVGVVVVVFFLTTPWQVVLIGALFMGPACLALPAVAGLKSSLVGPDEQGLMQAALNTIVNVAASVGTLTIGAIFDATNRQLLGGQLLDVEVNKLAFIIIAPLYLVPLWFVSRLRNVMRSEGLGEPHPGVESACESGKGAAGERLAAAQRRHRAGDLKEDFEGYGSTA